MKAVILAGGYGTRISEETHLKPKPMVEIGGKPLLWHIMKTYAAHGINEFIVCCGYKGFIIKEYFANYFLHMSDITFDMASNKMEIHQNSAEPWKVTLVDTGEKTMTGGRIKRIRSYLGDEDFCLTYGDGLSNVNIAKLICFHKKQNTMVTLTAVQPPGRFGALNIEGKKINSFSEKPPGDGAWINGGYFVMAPKAIEYIADDCTSWEKEPLEKVAQEGQLSAFLHRGFWQPCDTMRDKVLLENLWASNKAPWKLW